MPIIIVSARGEEVDRVVGLELGADDYVVKPFGLRELIARIRAVTRRAESRRRPTDDVIVAGPRPDRPAGAPRDCRRPRAAADGKEFDLLALLAREAGAVVDRERILREVWHTTWYGSSKTIDVHVAALRRKLGDPTLIETVRGIGLRLRRVSRRLLASYLALTVVVLVALEVPLAIVNARNERQDLTAKVERDAFAAASLAEDSLQAGTPVAGAAADRRSLPPRDRRADRDRRSPRAKHRRLASDDAERASASRRVPRSPPHCAARTVSGIRRSQTLAPATALRRGPGCLGRDGLRCGADHVPDLDARPPCRRGTGSRSRAWGSIVLAAAGLVGVLLARSVSAAACAASRRVAARIGARRADGARREAHGPPEVRRLASRAEPHDGRSWRRCSASQEQFVADASHELRTPLTALRLRLETGETEAALAEVERLSRLVDELLALARADQAGNAA